MNILISYNIENNSLRLKLANQLLAHGLIRVQYSVFIGQVPDRYLRRLEKVLTDLTGSDNWSEEDAILLLPLHQYSKDNLQSWGRTPSDWDLLNEPPHTLIL